MDAVTLKIIHNSEMITWLIDQLWELLYHDDTNNLKAGHHRKYTLLPCGHLDFESAVTAQNDKFEGSFHLSQETQYLALILSDTFIKCVCHNILYVVH